MYLRAYRPEDLSSLFALDLACFEPPFRFSRATMRRFAEARNALVRLACERMPDGSEQVLAFCVLHLERLGAALGGYVVTLNVAPSLRKRGLGTTLMRAMEQAARMAGAERIMLHVFAANDPAIRLYERLGYQFLGEAGDFYGRDLTALIYQKELLKAAESLTEPDGGGGRFMAS